MRWTRRKIFAAPSCDRCNHIPFPGRTTNIIHATNLALAELEGALLLADLEELHHALLIGSLASDLLDDVADKLDAASRALRMQ